MVYAGTFSPPHRCYSLREGSTAKLLLVKPSQRAPFNTRPDVLCSSGGKFRVQPEPVSGTRRTVVTAAVSVIIGGALSAVGGYGASVFGLPDKIDNLTKEVETTNRKVDKLDVKVDKLSERVAGLETGFQILLQATLPKK